MEFKSLKNIETSFRQIRLFCIVLVMFGLFALCSLYMIGSAIINFGNG